MKEWTFWLSIAALALVVLALAIALVRLRRQVDALVEEVAQQPYRNPMREAAADGGFETLASASSLRDGPSGPPQDTASTTGPQAAADGAAYVVTSMAESEVETRRIEGSLFADLLLRESVVRTAALVHGVRHALAAESRNRIRFLMRQEVKRSRKQRRVDLRAARRQLADLRRDEDAA